MIGSTVVANAHIQFVQSNERCRFHAVLGESFVQGFHCLRRRSEIIQIIAIRLANVEHRLHNFIVGRLPSLAGCGNICKIPFPVGQAFVFRVFG